MSQPIVSRLVRSCGRGYSSAVLTAKRTQEQHSGVTRRCRRERARRKTWTERARERALPCGATGTAGGRPSRCRPRRHDERGTLQLTPARGQPPEQRGRHTERRIRHHCERAPREPQVGGVGTHHLHRSTGEPHAQERRPLLVQLDGHDARAGAQQRIGDHATASTDVEDEVAARDVSERDEPRRPARLELVPTPARGVPGMPGHGRPSPSSRRGV